MKLVKVPWQKWLDEGEQTLTFPDSWEVTVAHMRGGPDIGDVGIAAAFASPLEAPRLAELASGRRNAVIAVDDISRPTPTYRLLPPVLAELAAGGISRDRVRIVVASGAHRASTRWELCAKLGREFVDTLDLVHHVPYENLVDLGVSRLGTPVRSNSFFQAGDLKLAIGSLIPHATAGFSGGRKLVAVGLSATSTLRAFHARDAGWLCTGYVDGNPQHNDLDDIMRMVGLDIAVEVVLTDRRDGIAALYVGEPSACFRAGVERAWSVYHTTMPRAADVVVLNAYPKDYDLLQALNALWVTLFPHMHIVRPGGTVVVTAACPDGEGLHYLASHGMSDPAWTDEGSMEGRHLVVHSPNVSEWDVRRHFPPSVDLCRTWSQVLAVLETRHGPVASATVYPYACLHADESRKGSGPLRL